MTDAVEAVDLVLAYGDRIALGRSTFAIPAGGLVAVIGPNGSGKSTLLGSLVGLHEPAAGSIRVLGRSPEEARPRIAYVLQSTTVNETIPLTVREVVAMGRFGALGVFGRAQRADREAVRAALERLDIASVATRHIRELSGGQRQRVFVAQGLAQEHDILLLDEPLTGLDVLSAQAIAEAIEEERRTGCTIVVTTHDLAAASEADHVVLLSRRVVASGPPSEALSPENLADAYGARILSLAADTPFVDDPAHLPATRRHAHRERSIHIESPGSDLHD